MCPELSILFRRGTRTPPRQGGFSQTPVKLKSCVNHIDRSIALAFKVSICPQAKPVEEMVDDQDITFLYQLHSFAVCIFLLICNIQTSFPLKLREDEAAAEDPYSVTEQARLPYTDSCVA